MTQPEVVLLIGRGVRSLVERAIERRAAEVDVEAVVQRFHSNYWQTVATEARLYPGARDGVLALRGAGLKLAVATNKPRRYTQRLLEYVQVDAMLDAVLAGDDGIAPKPAGDMLVAACKQMGVGVDEALMVGDSGNDVQAARAAGCRVWCVPYGYNEGLGVDSLDCDRVVATIGEAARLALEPS